MSVEIEPAYIAIMADRLQSERLAGIVELVEHSPLIVEASEAAYRRAVLSIPNEFIPVG